ncbi:hypothetical protein BKA70DRAFT_1472812 [Coprinopsis sp. MPI-PUGE-AT-0042]|nr:hypothetical protein BKA70DRAFT_1472812 [Coprinopsis sp. MPI-PUGE-AT-0042]
MEAPSDTLPTSPAPAVNDSDYSIGRPYLPKAFIHILLITLFSAISALLCSENLLDYLMETPRHFCDLTSYCGQLQVFPLLLFSLSALAFAPALLILDQFLASSPVFVNRVISNEYITAGGVQVQPTNNPEDEANAPSTGRSIYVRTLLKNFTIATFASAAMWLVACIAAVTSAALIITYDAPFDDRSDPKYKQRVILGLAEAASDLVLAALVGWLGVLYSRARRSIPANTASTGGVVPASPGRNPSVPAGTYVPAGRMDEAFYGMLRGPLLWLHGSQMLGYGWKEIRRNVMSLWSSRSVHRMDVPSDGSPVSPPAVYDPCIGRTHLAKAFKHILLVTPFTSVSALLCFVNMLDYFKETPRHFCNLTSYCTQLLSFPLPLFFLSALGFVPALLVLEHFLALSPAFGNKAVTSEHVNSDNVQLEPTNALEDDIHIPSTEPSNYARGILMIFTTAAYAAAILWVGASIAATTSAALIIKYDAPFDNRSDPKYKQRAIVGLVEATFDLVLALLVGWLGVLYSRARRSVPAETASISGGLSISAARTLRALARASLLDVWMKIRRQWDRRTSLDKPIFCLILTVGWMAITVMFYSASTPPTWKYFFALFWAWFSASFIAVAFYAMFCDPWRQEPHPLPCPREGQWLSFVMGVLGFLFAFALGRCGMAAWKSRVGIRLQDVTEGGEPMDNP